MAFPHNLMTADEEVDDAATIVRDALAKWAADRGLPGPPGTAAKSQRKVGDRGPEKPEGGKAG